MALLLRTSTPPRLSVDNTPEYFTAVTNQPNACPYPEIDLTSPKDLGRVGSRLVVIRGYTQDHMAGQPSPDDPFDAPVMRLEPAPAELTQDLSVPGVGAEVEDLQQKHPLIEVPPTIGRLLICGFTRLARARHAASSPVILVKPITGGPDRVVPRGIVRGSHPIEFKSVGGRKVHRTRTVMVRPRAWVLPGA